MDLKWMEPALNPQ